MKSESGIAVVGVGCWYPGARSPREFWENILARRRAFRTFPDCRLPLSDYHSKDRGAPDKTYGTRGAFIDGFVFDYQKRRIPKSTFDSTDIAQWLALEVAIQAIEDAGFSIQTIPSHKTGVIVGNTLTGEQTRSSAMRLRWPFVRRAFEAASQSCGLPGSLSDDLSASMEEYYKSVFAPITEDSLAGGLSNTIAGRISNFLNLDGGGYTVDGACSSSLIAVVTAARAIAAGDLDMALAGGVDISLDTFELIGFAKTGALTPDDMSVYDKRGNGFLPGEGSGFVVLKSLEAARRDGNSIYAVLRGFGVSSDGKGGITAPKAEGQALALKRAYEVSGYSPSTVHFIEGHGTGTTVGDRVELEGISIAIESSIDQSQPRSCGVTSLKSIIGHTKAAAGVGGFIKAVLAVNQRVIPPTAGCVDWNPVFDTRATKLYPVMSGEIFSPDFTLRAGVSAMGFGGINSHVTLESGDAPITRVSPSRNEKILLNSPQDSEVFAFSAPSHDDLKSRIQEALTLAQGISDSELLDLSVLICEKAMASAGKVRAGVVAKSPAHLVEQLTQLLEKETFSECGGAPKIGFLYAGQGSQFLNMGRKLISRHVWAHETLQKSGFQELSDAIYFAKERAADPSLEKFALQRLSETQTAQPAISLTSVLWTKKLAHLGIAPTTVAGHSLGELTAFWAAGLLDEPSLFMLASQRGKAMSADAQTRGTMASLACDKLRAENLCATAAQIGDVVVANINSPEQTVISGEIPAVEAVLKLAQEEGISGKRLNVSNAFHSKLVSRAAEQLAKLQFSQISTPAHAHAQIISGMNAQKIQRDVDLNNYFSTQVLAQVDFVALTHAMAENCDFLIEVGPGRILTGLCKDTLGVTAQCFPVESRANSDLDLNNLLAALHVAGQDIRWSALFEDRFYRPFTPASEKKFIENPCERPFGMFGEVTAVATSNASSLQPRAEVPSLRAKRSNPEASKEVATGTVYETLLETICAKTGFDTGSLSNQMRLLDDLNLDSIKAAELITQVGRKLGIPGRIDPLPYANATLEELSQVFSNSASTPAPQTIKEPSVVRAWEMEWVPEPLDTQTETPLTEQDLLFVCDSQEILTKDLNELCKGFSEVAKAAQKARSLTIVGLGEGLPLQSFAATLHLEKPDLKVRHLVMPSDNELKKHVARELSTTSTYETVVYDKDWNRKILRPKVLEAGLIPKRNIQWNESDVVLVTGGAKGITAQCAFAFAQETRVRVALLGSSHSCDAGLLKQYADAGLTAHYYKCDVSSYEQIEHTIRTCEEELGQVTGVIHGAGLNRPRRADLVSADEAYAEIAPKTLGARNLTNAFCGKNLKLFASLTSIIGVTGMQGNAWYALSNELTDAAAGAFEQDNGGTHVVSIAYSVWDEVGMGARMGSVDQLGKMGVGAIPVEDGVKRFLQLCDLDTNARQIVVAASLSGLDTWRPAKAPLLNPQFRFVENILSLEPGVEARVEANLHPSRDPYLNDHLYKGSLLFPTVFGLEAMAQVASLLAPELFCDKQLTIENIQLEKPLVVDPHEGLKIRIHAQMQERSNSHEPMRVKVGIRPSAATYTDDHFSAEFLIGSSLAEKLSNWSENKSLLVPKRDLYGPILFQGPVFQRIESILMPFGLAPEGTLGLVSYEVSTTNTEHMLLGDPYSRDALLQSVQVVIPQDRCLPVRIDRIDLQNTQSNVSVHRCVTVLEKKEGQEYVASVLEYNDNGELCQKLLGYRLKILETDAQAPSFGDLMDPGQRDEERLRLRVSEQCTNLGLTAPQISFRFVHGIGSMQKSERQGAQIAVLPDLTWDDSGKPQTKDQQISISHDESWLLATTGTHAQGCDLIQVTSREESVWLELLGPLHRELFLTLIQSGIAKDEAGSKIWSAREAALKATGSAQVFQWDNTSEMFSIEGSNLTVLTFLFTATVGGSFYVALVLEKENVQHSSTAFWMEKGESGEALAHYRFPVLMEDVASVSKKIHFSRYFSWMGRIREMGLAPVLKDITRLTDTGRWGIVTNECTVEIFAEADANDHILGKLSLAELPSELRDSTLELVCDWHIDNKNGQQLLARSRMRTTWVAIVGYGMVKREPMPMFLQQFCHGLGYRRNLVMPAESFVMPAQAGIQNNNVSKILSRETFATDLEESNLIGNIYFSHYAKWQARTRDRFFHRKHPESYTQAQSGEWICLRAKVEHLREAMPFDSIEVVQSVAGLGETGVRLHFDYYRVQDGATPVKLAVGEQECVWGVRDKDGNSIASPIPKDILASLS